MIDISKERWFGAKASEVGGQRVVDTHALDGAVWQLLDVDGVRYQVLADGGRDVLAERPELYLNHLAELGEIHGELAQGAPRAMGAEQSNTNLVVGGNLVKVFRKLEPGLNPDVEILSRITNPHVAPVTAWVTRGDYTLALQQELVGGEDGFELAVSGADIDEHALGRAIASVHESLRREFGVGEAVLAGELNARLDAYLAHPKVAAVLGEFESRIRALYTVLERPLPVQRVHGDLHLGQTLNDANHWTLIDFEGEPARPLAERRRMDHALRDVAGMVRSFGYAEAVGAERGVRLDVEELLAGYGLEGGQGGGPDAAGERDGASERDVLNAYIADKAAYEVVYEANNRPDWVDIPLDALRSIL